MWDADPRTWQLTWDIAQFVLTGIVGIYVYLTQREQVRRDALQRLETDVDDRLDELHTGLTRIMAQLEQGPHVSRCAAHEQRLAVLEEAHRGTLKSSDLGRVHARIDAIDTGLAELRGETKAMSHLLQTIDHHLRQISHPHTT